jgi:hypothetical protein
MKEYNFDFMKKMIEQEKKNGLLFAEAGMKEDWGWTCEEVWRKEDLYDIDIFQNKEIAGIPGSNWATPIMVLHYKKDKEIIVECYEDDGEKVSKKDKITRESLARRTSGGDYKQ